jgi:hypothetical protein
MADTFYAVSHIEGGHIEEDGSANGKHVPVSFEPGDKVTGLDSATMKGLWRAGALTRTAPESDEAESDDEGPEVSDSKPSRPAKVAPAKATSTATS